MATIRTNIGKISQPIAILVQKVQNHFLLNEIFPSVVKKNVEFCFFCIHIFIVEQHSEIKLGGQW